MLTVVQDANCLLPVPFSDCISFMLTYFMTWDKSQPVAGRLKLSTCNSLSQVLKER